MSHLALDQTASPGQPAIRGEAAPPVSYGELQARIGHAVRLLRSRGVARDSRVAAVLPHGPELAVAFVAVSAAAAFAPLNPAYSTAEFWFFLADLAPTVLLTGPGFCPAAEEAARSLDVPLLSAADLRSGPRSFTGDVERNGGDETALLLHSSGTTARPKLVPLSHRNLSTSARTIAATLRLSPEDRCLNIMPLFHIHGLVGALLSSLAAGALVLCPEGFQPLSPGRVFRGSEATWYTAVPSLHQAVLKRLGPAAAWLRLVRSSSAHLHTPLWRQLEEHFGCPVLNSYGMTEASHQMASTPLSSGERVYGTVGPATGLEMMVAGADGTPVPAGCPGEIVVRGPSVTAGYVSPPEANCQARFGDWFRTGDEGFLDVRGYLTLTGRLKEMINVAGEKVSPAEVDAALVQHPAVLNAVAFGAPCPQRGERVCAAVVLRPGHEAAEQELQVFLREHLARFKVPAVIRFLDDIPKGATGKVQRLGLAAQLGLAG